VDGALFTASARWSIAADWVAMVTKRWAGRMSRFCRKMANNPFFLGAGLGRRHRHGGNSFGGAYAAYSQA
jgi:hypothetical protein